MAEARLPRCRPARARRDPPPLLRRRAPPRLLPDPGPPQRERRATGEQRASEPPASRRRSRSGARGSQGAEKGAPGKSSAPPLADSTVRVARPPGREGRGRGRQGRGLAKETEAGRKSPRGGADPLPSDSGVGIPSPIFLDVEAGNLHLRTPWRRGHNPTTFGSEGGGVWSPRNLVCRRRHLGNQVTFAEGGWFRSLGPLGLRKETAVDLDTV